MCRYMFMVFGIRSRAQREAEKDREYGEKLRSEAIEKAKTLPSEWVHSLGPEGRMLRVSPKFPIERGVPLLPDCEIETLRATLANGLRVSRDSSWAHHVATTFTGVQDFYLYNGTYPALLSDGDIRTRRARAMGLLTFHFTSYSRWSIFLQYQDSEPAFRALSASWKLHMLELEDAILCVAACRSVASGLSGPLRRSPSERIEFMRRNRAMWANVPGNGFVEAFWGYVDRGMPNGDKAINLAVEVLAIHGPRGVLPLR